MGETAKMGKWSLGAVKTGADDSGRSVGGGGASHCGTFPMVVVYRWRAVRNEDQSAQFAGTGRSDNRLLLKGR